MRRVILASFALALLLGVSPPSLSAEQLYADAVAQMRGHAQPTFATYEASISGLNCGVQNSHIDCTLGRSTPQSQAPLSIELRESDGRLALRRDGVSAVFGDSTFLNATWPGIDAIIQHGFLGTGSAASSTPPPMESPSELPVIAVVAAFSVANYNVFDAGATPCENGNAGHSVRLVARRDPLRHPLTGATIDLTSGDICAVRFNARVNAAAGLVGATGGAQLDLENVDGYDVVTNERFDIDLRAIGIAVKHVTIKIGYSDFAFPKAIDPTIFTTPSPAPPH